MLDQTIRQTILTLRDAGNGIRAIARALGVSRVAVKRVLAEGQASPPQLERAEKAEPYRDEILALYAECKGNLVRVHEELLARQLVTLSYPALTAFCRKHGIGHEPAKPAGRYHFAPGKEMQHDTSPHDAHIGGALRRVQTARWCCATRTGCSFSSTRGSPGSSASCSSTTVRSTTTARASTAWSTIATSSCSVVRVRTWCRCPRWRRTGDG